MNSGTLAEQVNRILVSGNLTTEQDIEEREVQKVVQQIVDSVLQNYLFQLNKAEKNESFRIPREFLAENIVDLVDNKCTLPSTPLQFPNNKTVYEAVIAGEDCDMKGQMLIPITSPLGIHNKSEKGDLGGYYGYQLRGKDVSIVGAGTVVLGQVAFYYVPSAISLSVDEDLTIPSFLHDEVIKQSVQQLMPHISLERDNKQDNKEYSSKEYNNNGR